MPTPSRRRVLRAAGSTAAVGLSGELGGCSGVFGSGEQTTGGPAFVKPGSLTPSSTPYAFEVNALATNAEVADALPDSTRDQVLSAGDWIDDTIGVDPSAVESITTGGVRNLNPLWAVAKGSFDPEPASSYEADGTYKGYDVYTGADQYFGVTDGRLVSVGAELGTAGTRAMLTTVVDVVETQTNGLADTDAGFYVEHIGDHTYTVVFPTLRHGLYYTFAESTTEMTLVVEERDADVGAYETVDDWLPSGQEIREHASDVEFSTDTGNSTVRLSGTIPTEVVDLRETDLLTM